MDATRRAVLSSWKEIATYLGKGVRTVQRWERELKLPVRRPVAHNERIVIAVPDELDTWVKQQLSPGGSPRDGDAAHRHHELQRMRRLLRHTAEEMRQIRVRTAHLVELVELNQPGRNALATTRSVGGPRGEARTTPDESGRKDRNN